MAPCRKNSSCGMICESVFSEKLGPPDFQYPAYQDDVQVRLLHGEPVGGDVGKKKRR